MTRKLKKDIYQLVSNLPGWRTKRRIIVFESDDWGSIRMSSKIAFAKLEEKGIDLRSADAERYNLNDSLETSPDLENLFEVLSSFKDHTGNSAVITPICIVGNPDFNKIRKSDYSKYFYEPFIETYMRYPGCEKTFPLWKEGIQKKLFIPQMHGREHLNVTAWLNDLRKDNSEARLAFDEEVTGFVPLSYPKVDYQAAFMFDDLSELSVHGEIISEGLDLFEEIFGYRAQYFVPPNGPINNSLNKILIEKGVRFRSVSRVQNEPLGKGRQRRVFHWLGQQDKNGIRYITRNCFFEPSQSNKDWVDSCLNDIKISFNWQKPAVISSHRVNYIGALNPANQSQGLRALSSLFEIILKSWPDVEFMTTPQLGSLMDN